MVILAALGAVTDASEALEVVENLLVAELSDLRQPHPVTEDDRTRDDELVRRAVYGNHRRPGAAQRHQHRRWT